MKLTLTKLLKNYPELNKKTATVVLKKCNQQKLKGKGFLDSLVNKTVEAYNRLRGKKPDKRDHVLKDGEKHAVFKNKKGALVRAQFAGPGTDLSGNLKSLLKKNENDISLALRKENFVSDVDKIALTHDIRYELYGKDKDKIRQADKKMISKINEINDEPRFNTLPSKLGIQAKILGENVRVLKRDQFTGDRTLNDEDTELVQRALDHLEMQGYGRSRPIRKGYHIMPDGSVMKDSLMGYGPCMSKKTKPTPMPNYLVQQELAEKRIREIDIRRRAEREQDVDIEYITELATHTNMTRDEIIDAVYSRREKKVSAKIIADRAGAENIRRDRRVTNPGRRNQFIRDRRKRRQMQSIGEGLRGGRDQSFIQQQISDLREEHAESLEDMRETIIYEFGSVSRAPSIIRRVIDHGVLALSDGDELDGDDDFILQELTSISESMADFKDHLATLIRYDRTVRDRDRRDREDQRERDLSGGADDDSDTDDTIMSNDIPVLPVVQIQPPLPNIQPQPDIQDLLNLPVNNFDTDEEDTVQTETPQLNPMDILNRYDILNALHGSVIGFDGIWQTLRIDYPTLTQALLLSMLRTRRNQTSPPRAPKSKDNQGPPPPPPRKGRRGGPPNPTGRRLF